MILAQAYSRFVLDLDGVVWRGNEPVASAPETVRRMREAGKRICFVTNNSSPTHEWYAKKLIDMGAGADVHEIVTSADAVATVLGRHVTGIRGRAAFVIGGEGLRAAVESTGARLVDGKDAADASLVVIGWDRALTYDKLKWASLAIQRGAAFVASNVDGSYPAPEGLIPGTGATAAAIQATTGVKPIVAGKPEPVVLEIARERLGGGPALVVGDRLDSDVMAARAMEWPAALVMSGVSGIRELALASIWPDYLLRDLTELLEDLPHPTVRPAGGPDLAHVASILHEGGLHVGAARERLGRTVVAELDREVIGTAGWDPAGDAAVIRSVAVAARWRGRRTGLALTAAAARSAAAAGYRVLYCATVDAAPFFQELGFRRVAREDLPAAVAGHPQISRECPASAAVMRLAL